MINTNRPQDVYNIVDSDVVTAPSDWRVVRNTKAAAVRSQKAANGQASCCTFGDEVQVVLELIKTDDFIRRVFLQKDSVPSVILYTDRQIADIKGLCFDRKNGSVIGVDKTFNLGSVYVTASVYKNSALKRARSGDSHILLGPIFVHGRSDTDTYADFFGHLSGKLMGGDFQALTLGSDDELAMSKCLIHFFPRACIVVCSRHIKENVVRKLDELLGKSSDVRRQLLDALYGSCGLVSLDNVVAFDNAVDKLRAPTGLLTNAPGEFQQYFQRCLVQLMRDNCAAGRSTWTNNNCE